MQSQHKVKFSSQADSLLLKQLREIAQVEGRQFQALLDEAMRDLIDKKNGEKARPHVLEAFSSSLNNFNDLYKHLAK